MAKMNKLPDAGLVQLRGTIEAKLAGEIKPGDSVNVRMVAYNGDGKAFPKGWRDPVIFDLSGLQFEPPFPVLSVHMNGLFAVCGQIDAMAVEGSQLIAEGRIVPATDEGKQAIELIKSEITLQASIGAQRLREEFIEAGAEAKVNGAKISGPCVLVHEAIIREVSLVPYGASTGTSVEKLTSEVTEMADEKELKEVKLEGGGTPDAKTVDAALSGEIRTPVTAPDMTEQATKSARDAGAGEIARQATIAKLCGDMGDYADVPQDRRLELQGQAVKESWDTTKLELELTRAGRERAPAAHVRSGAYSEKTLECALRLAGGTEGSEAIEKAYDEPTMEAAYKLQSSGLGVSKLAAACCQLEGKPAPRFDSSPIDIALAGFSTSSFPSVLANTANKVLMDAFREAPGMAMQLTRRLSTKNFLTHSGVRTTADLTFEEVGPQGELKHGSARDGKFEYSVDTYGKMFGLTRTDIINDDLSAFTRLPVDLARGGRRKIEQTFWNLVISNAASFFATGNSNYFTGTTSVLGSDSLSKAVQYIRQMTDGEGNPIEVTPKFLVVPPELETTAEELYTALNNDMYVASGTTRQPTKNIHGGRYAPVVVPYLSNTTFNSSASTTAWYLWGDPNDVAAYGLSFLRGVDRPTVEEVTPSPEYLGRLWRGYIDFGVCEIDPQGAVKSKGAA